MTNDPYGLRSLDVEDLRRRRVLKWQSTGSPYAAWIADMDFPVMPAVAERLHDLIDRNELGYQPDAAWPLSAAALLFEQRMADRFGWEPTPGRIHEMNDVVQGIRAVIHHLSAPGDGIVLHLPAYHPFIDSIETMGRRLIDLQPHEINDDRGALERYVFDYDELDARLAREPARIWVLCHPHNPLGHVFERAELDRIAEIAERHDLIVISDEIHADLSYSPGHIAFASLGDEIAARTVTVTSPSKAFNLAGLRWAVLHAGHTATHRALAALPGHYLGVTNAMAVAAATTAWTEGDAWLAAVMAVLDENRQTLGTLLSDELPGARYRPPLATYLAWIDVSNCGLPAGESPAVTFRQRGVELSPGEVFGTVGATHVRLNFATSPAILQATVSAMGGRPLSDEEP